MADNLIRPRRLRRALTIDADILALVSKIEAHQDTLEEFLRDRFNPAEERVRANPRNQLARKRFERVRAEAGVLTEEFLDLMRRLAATSPLSRAGLSAKARIYNKVGLQLGDFAGPSPLLA